LEVAVRLISQVQDALTFPRPETQADTIVQAITTLAEYKPDGIMQATLAAQMIATNDAAALFMRRATLPNQPSEFTDLNIARATRLMRLHLEQIEAMQKLKGLAGHQKIVVERVEVQPAVRRL
jgi:hypothetical protein